MTKIATQKDIVRDLDRAAANVSDFGGRGASSKQTWFLAGLLLKAGLTAAVIDCGPADLRAKLCAKKASAYIDAMLNAKGDALSALANA